MKSSIVFWKLSLSRQSHTERDCVKLLGQRKATTTKRKILSVPRSFKWCPQRAHEAERDSLAQRHTALAAVRPSPMPVPASKSEPSLSMNTARAAGPEQSFVFSRKNLSKAKPTTLNPLNRLITADSLTSKGLSKHRRVSTSTEIGVKSQSKWVWDEKREEEEEKIWSLL